LYSSLPDGTVGRGLIAFLLPTAAAVILGIARVLGRNDPFLEDEDTLAVETTQAIVSAGILFVLTLHFLILGMLLTRAPAGGAVLLLAALVLAFTGNVLPRTRPNMVVGIRTERTLTSRRVWLRTHRVVGNVAVGLGGATAVAAFLPHGARMLLMSAVLLVGVCTLVASAFRKSHA
jgi:uncharacterized membrane protein